MYVCVTDIKDFVIFWLYLLIHWPQKFPKKIYNDQQNNPHTKTQQAHRKQNYCVDLGELTLACSEFSLLQFYVTNSRFLRIFDD